MNSRQKKADDALGVKINNGFIKRVVLGIKAIICSRSTANVPADMHHIDHPVDNRQGSKKGL